MLDVKQGDIQYDVLSLWYDSSWDWTPVSRTIGEHYSIGYWPGNTVSKLYVSKSNAGERSRVRPDGFFCHKLQHRGVGEGTSPFTGLLHFNLDTYLIMLSVKQEGIKYHLMHRLYDSTAVSQTIGEISTSM